MIDMVLLSVTLVACMTVVWHVYHGYEESKKKAIRKRDSYPRHKG